MSPMRIAHVITTIEVGGAENQLLGMVSEQIKNGEEITVFPLKGKPILISGFRESGAKVDLSLINAGIVRQILYINRIVKKNFDVVHAHLPQAEFACSFSVRKSVVVTRHYGGKFAPKWPQVASMIISRWVTRKSVVVAISQHVETIMRQNKEIRRSKDVKVVHYGATSSIRDLGSKYSEYKKQIARNDSAENPFNFVAFARLSPEKGLDVLLKAFRLVKNVNSNATLKIYGEGSEWKNLQELALNLGLNPVDIFRGKTSEVALAMAKATVVVVPSRFEGFGMVYLEALSARLPIIASQISTAEEILGKGGAALFFIPEDERSLSRIMLEWRKQISPSFRDVQASVLEKYTIEQVVARYKSIYVLMKTGSKTFNH